MGPKSLFAGGPQGSQSATESNQKEIRGKIIKKVMFCAKNVRHAQKHDINQSRLSFLF